MRSRSADIIALCFCAVVLAAGYFRVFDRLLDGRVYLMGWLALLLMAVVPAASLLLVKQRSGDVTRHFAALAAMTGLMLIFGARETLGLVQAGSLGPQLAWLGFMCATVTESRRAVLSSTTEAPIYTRTAIFAVIAVTTFITLYECFNRVPASTSLFLIVLALDAGYVVAARKLQAASPKSRPS